jgi:hypothetical protein
MRNNKELNSMYDNFNKAMNIIQLPKSNISVKIDIESKITNRHNKNDLIVSL